MRLTRRSVNMGSRRGWRRLRSPPSSRRRRYDQDWHGGVGHRPRRGPRQIWGDPKIALDRVNKLGGALGKQIELLIEDDQTTNPGAVLAFSKLAGQPDIVAFIGQVRSTQTHAMAPDILKTGKPVCFGGTVPR